MQILRMVMSDVYIEERSCRDALVNSLYKVLIIYPIKPQIQRIQRQYVHSQRNGTRERIIRTPEVNPWM